MGSIPEEKPQVPPLRLRSGRDDNFVTNSQPSPDWGLSHFPATKLSSRPERTRISCYAALANARVCGFQ